MFKARQKWVSEQRWVSAQSLTWLEEIKPVIHNKGHICIREGGTAMPLMEARNRNADKMKLRTIASQRLKLATCCTMPLPAPLEGQCKLITQLHTWQQQQAMTVHNCLYEVKGLFTLAQTPDQVQNVQHLITVAFDAIEAVIFPIRPEATDIREGRIGLGERMEMEVEVYTDETWGTLQHAYDLLEQIILLPEVDGSKTNGEKDKVFTPHFLNKLMGLFKSLDPRYKVVQYKNVIQYNTCFEKYSTFLFFCIYDFQYYIVLYCIVYAFI